MSTTQTIYPRLDELIPAHWQQNSVSAADATLHYWRTGGEKPALVLLHGIQVDGLMWLRTAQAVEAGYDVIMPDFRGHGQSSAEASTFATDTLVTDTTTLMAELGVSKAFVVGHSMGADVAGRLAANYPELVQSVILVDPALQSFMPPTSGDNEPPPWMQHILTTMQALKSQSHEERMVSARALLPPGTGANWHAADYVTFVDGMAHFETAIYRYSTNMAYLFAEPQTIAQITCPLLLLTARPAMPGASQSQGLAAFTGNWQQGQHIDFPDSGHFIPFDQFDRFIEVVSSFLYVNAP